MRVFATNVRSLSEAIDQQLSYDDVTSGKNLSAPSLRLQCHRNYAMKRERNLSSNEDRAGESESIVHMKVFIHLHLSIKIMESSNSYAH